MRRIVSLPKEGKLIVATDVQGNVRDFDAIARVFEEANERPGGATLVMTGDLVHGPEIAASDWPDHLGTFYEGDSEGVLTKARALEEKHPGRVHYLLGNHEHAHIGGPVVSKFFPNEAARLESILGPKSAGDFQSWIAGWPLVAVAERAGICMLHAAPHAIVATRDDIEQLTFEGDDVEGRYTLLNLLWPRTTTEERARAFMRALSEDLRVAVYGHDVARGGYAIDREPLLCVSTSFGCYDGDKMYLEWDLSRQVASAGELAREGLRLLYPHATPIHRAPLPGVVAAALDVTDQK